MRRRRSRFPASALAGLLLFGSAAGSSELSVRFIDPPPDVPLFNLVEVAAEVTSTERVDRVEFFLGGELVEVDRSPPYRAVIDVGDENLERRLAVVAHSSSGTRARADLVAPAIRVDETVDLPLQQLYVTATDESGEPVLDLTQDDFSVLDLGQEEELVTFTRGNVPLTIALLIDASESMRGERLDIALEAAQRFAARLGALDEAQVVVFSDRIHRISNAPTDVEELEEQLGSVRATGGTALNDHLYAALRLLDGRQGRPVVILFSDGADTVSLLSMEQVHWKVRRSDAAIYAVQGGGNLGRRVPLGTAWRTAGESSTEVAGMEKAVRDSGGRLEFIQDVGSLDVALEQILEELRQQYVLGYYPREPRGNGQWRPVRVRAARPGVGVRARVGYVDD